jgi:glycosyltransferase involved in cell wall biosynthesis
MTSLALSIVIPAYNEEERIAATVEEAARYLAGRGGEGEVILADDGSTDATVERARSAACHGIDVRILPVEKNRGKGDAVRRGVLAAAGDVVLFTDADLSTPLAEFDRFQPAMEAGHPVVIGSRKLEPARVVRRQPWFRQYMGRVFSWLARRLLNPHVADFTCGFKAFRREVVPVLFEPLTLAGWAFDAELLHVAHRRGVPVLELPVAWSNRSDTRVRLRRDVMASAAGLLVIVWNGWRGRYASGQST